MAEQQLKIQKVQYEKLTYSIPEAAKVLGISEYLMYPLSRSQGFPVITIGKRRLIPIKALNQWLESQTGTVML